MVRLSLPLCSVVFLTVGFLGSLAWSCGGYWNLDTVRPWHLDFSKKAVSEDPAVAGPAIRALRFAGPVGVDAMFKTHGKAISELRAGVESPELQRLRNRLRNAIEKISRQKDGHTSGLYWFTDLNRARSAAQLTGRPILSLRLLGKLDEEHSCANSRFFRTALYANQEVAKALHDRFILHWESVRPVPKISIDFGDGRKIERTITGNSLHLVLDSRGRPVDAIPGLYGPGAFLKALVRPESFARATAAMDAPDRADFLAEAHQRESNRVRTRWEHDLVRLGQPSRPLARVATRRSAALDVAAPAVKAQRRTMSKMMVQAPLLSHVSRHLSLGELEKKTDPELWQRIAQLHAADARLDARSRELIRCKQGSAEEMSQVSRVFLRMVAGFERSIAEDTVMNEYRLHPRIHDWFQARSVGEDPKVLTSRIYDELFHSPDSDPWMGLALRDVYSALPDGGLVKEQDQ